MVDIYETIGGAKFDKPLCSKYINQLSYPLRTKVRTRDLRRQSKQREVGRNIFF